MSEELVRNMNAGEARIAVASFVQSGMRLRWQLLEMFERQAHKALHFDSFEDFAKKELHLVMEPTYLSRLIHWAQVERNVFGSKLSTELYNVQLPDQQLATTVEKMHKIPRTVALELAKLPSPEAQRIAWKEYYERSEAHKAGAVSVTYAARELKHVVASTLANTPGGAPPKRGRKPKIAPVAPVAPSVTAVITVPSRTVASSAEDALGITIIKEKPPLPRIDWEEAEWIMELAGSWVKAKGFGGPKTSLCAAAAMLHAIANWIEEGA